MLNHTDGCWPRRCDTEPLGINTKVIQHLRRIKWRAGSRTDRHADKPAGRLRDLLSVGSRSRPRMLFHRCFEGLSRFSFFVVFLFFLRLPQHSNGRSHSLCIFGKKWLHWCGDGVTRVFPREWADDWRKEQTQCFTCAPTWESEQGRVTLSPVENCVGECVGRAAPAHSNYFPFMLQEVVFKNCEIKSYFMVLVMQWVPFLSSFFSRSNKDTTILYKSQAGITAAISDWAFKVNQMYNSWKRRNSRASLEIRVLSLL